MIDFIAILTATQYHTCVELRSTIIPNGIPRTIYNYLVLKNDLGQYYCAYKLGP